MGWLKSLLVSVLLSLAKYEAFAEKYGRVESGKWSSVTEITEEEESSSDDLEPLASKGGFGGFGGFDHTFKYENSFGPRKYAFEYRRDGPNTYRERVEKTDGTNYHTKYNWADGHGAGGSHFPSFSFDISFGHGDGHGKGSGPDRRKDYKSSLPWHDGNDKRRSDHGNQDGGDGHRNRGDHHDGNHRRSSNSHNRDGHEHNDKIDRGDKRTRDDNKNNHHAGSSRHQDHKQYDNSDGNGYHKHHGKHNGGFTPYDHHDGENAYRNDNGHERYSHHGRGDSSRGRDGDTSEHPRKGNHANRGHSHDEHQKQPTIKRRTDNEIHHKKRYKGDGYGGENNVHE